MADRIGANFANLRNSPLALRAVALWGRSWLTRVLVVWSATRLVATLLFLWAASTQGPSPWSPGGKPQYFDFLNIWDVEWYHRIFDFGIGHVPGYAVHLPTFADGSVQQNSWAFMPGFPLLIRGLTFLTGGLVPWKVLAPTASLVLSFALAVMIYKLFRLKFDEGVSLWGLTLFGFWATSPVLQVGYAETLGLLFLTGGLYYLLQHRYLMAVPWLVGLSVTRPGMVSFAAMLFGMWIVRWFKHRSGNVFFTTTERWQLGGLAIFSGVLGLAWPIFAWIITGRMDAYTATELAWRYSGANAHLILMDGWFGIGSLLLGPQWGWVFVLFAVTLAVWVQFSKSVRQLGNELRLWNGAYFLYLLLVFNPQSSTFRILMPAFPLMAALAFKTRNLSATSKWFVLVFMTITQMVWLALCWVYVNPDYTPP
ncbi:MAG: hypothetical protein RL508_83 [Actinomycetota bacterium]